MQPKQTEQNPTIQPAPWVHVATLRGLARRQGIDSISAHALAEAAKIIEEYAAEIGRLRAVVRVNALRAGATNAEIAEVLGNE
jgi:histone H3/H4